MQDFDRQLDQLLSAPLAPIDPLPAGRHVIYGAGNIGREIAARLAGMGREVCAFLDLKGPGEISGIPVYSPESDDARRLAGEGMIAIIGVFNYAADPHAIRARLEELGYRRIVGFAEFREESGMPAHFWLTKRSYVTEHADRVRAAAGLFADERSRDIFLDTLRLRLTFDTSLLRDADPEQQYLPDDLPRPRMPLRFIDAGAFDGDTIELLLRRGAAFEAIAAFEPDPVNFRALSKTTLKHGEMLGEVTLWPCGLSDHTGMAAFSAGKDQASGIAAEGNMHIQLVALDEVMPDFRPTFMKFDIEGAELAALKGAAHTITRHQPTVAVCVYHCPGDLWEIPLYLRELLPAHRIALRYHKFQGFDMVAYAFPPTA